MKGNTMGKWVDEFKGLIWTLAGTGIVLITLSGTTLKRGLWITLLALGLYLAVSASTQRGEDDE